MRKHLFWCVLHILLNVMLWKETDLNWPGLGDLCATWIKRHELLSSSTHFRSQSMIRWVASYFLCLSWSWDSSDCVTHNHGPGEGCYWCVARGTISGSPHVSVLFSHSQRGPVLRLVSLSSPGRRHRPRWKLKGYRGLRLGPSGGANLEFEETYWSHVVPAPNQ